MNKFTVAVLASLVAAYLFYAFGPARQGTQTASGAQSSAVVADGDVTINNFGVNESLAAGEPEEVGAHSDEPGSSSPGAGSTRSHVSAEPPPIGAFVIQGAENSVVSGNSADRTGGAGVIILDAPGALVENNKLNDVRANPRQPELEGGIIVQDSPGSSVRNSAVDNYQGPGVHVERSDGTTVDGVDVRNAQ